MTTSSHAAVDRKKLLILGGTREGRELAERLRSRFSARLVVCLSLAGVTSRNNAAHPDDIVGGFGGTAGLADFLHAQDIAVLVDATHPFAAAMSENASTASLLTGTPLVRLERPAWRAGPDDYWQPAADLAAGATALPANARVLLTLGARGCEPFVRRSDCQITARMIEAPSAQVPRSWQIIQRRPPFSLPGELALFKELQLTHLVTKNSGGIDVDAKLAACRALDVCVVMVERPPRPTGEYRTVQSVDDALALVMRYAG